MIHRTTGRRLAGQGGIYYGWWVILAGGTVGFLGFGAIIPRLPGFRAIVTKGFGHCVGAVRLRRRSGVGRGQRGVAGAPDGWRTVTAGRRLVLIGGLLSCAGFASVAGVSSYWQLALAYSGISAIGRGIGIVPNLMTIANQWFVRRKALTMTLLNTAFAGGAAVMVPLLSWCLGEFGWRTTILGAGAMAAALTVGAAIVIRSRPEDIGLLPDGVRPEGGSEGARGRRIEPTYAASDLTVRQALATPAFWLLTVGVTLRIAAADALVINQIPMLVWKGIPEEQAAFFLSSTFLAIIPLRIAMGVAATWLPSQWLIFAGMSVGAAGTAAFLAGTGYVAAGLFVVSIAATEGVATLGWLAVGEYFGRRSFGTLVGAMTVSFGAASLLAAWSAGLIFDQTGTYAAALVVAAALQLLSGLCYLLARRPEVEVS